MFAAQLDSGGRQPPQSIAKLTPASSWASGRSNRGKGETDVLLGDIVRLNATKSPARPAIIDSATGHEVTYGELYGRSNQLANALADIAEPGDRVAILAENLPEFIEAYFGVPSVGMALTFLNYRLNPKEWGWILGNAEARALIVQDKFLESVLSLIHI